MFPTFYIFLLHSVFLLHSAFTQCRIFFYERIKTRSLLLTPTARVLLKERNFWSVSNADATHKMADDVTKMALHFLRHELQLVTLVSRLNKGKRILRQRCSSSRSSKENVDHGNAEEWRLVGGHIVDETWPKTSVTRDP